MERKRTWIIILSIIVVMYGYNIKYLPVNLKLIILTIVSLGSLFSAYALIKHYRTIPVIILSVCMIISLISITTIEYFNSYPTINKEVISYLYYVIGISSFLMISSLVYQLIKYGDKNSRIGGIICLVIFTTVGIGVAYILVNY